MPIQLISKKCVRRIRNIRCLKDKIKGSAFCSDHVNDRCVCGNQAMFTCREDGCNVSLCATCQHHDSYGY